MTLSNGLQAVLFDLDGTLTDSEEAVNASFEAAARSQGYELDAASLAAEHGPLMMDVLVDRVGIPRAVAEAMRREYLVVYARDYMQQTAEMPYASVLLERLRSEGIPLGVVTNKGEAAAREAIDLMNWGDHFAVVVGNDTAARYKPWPDPVLHALAALEVEGSVSAYAGDREADMESARAAGVATIIGLTGTRDAASLRSAGATVVCGDLREMERVLVGS